MFLPPWADNHRRHWVGPAVQKWLLQSASTVYIGNKKDHCSQPRKSRHQMCRQPSSGRVRRRACGLPYPASGRRSLHVGSAPRRRRPGRCSPFHAPIPPAFSSVRRGRGGDSPACRPGADGRCASPVTLPRIPLAVLGVPLRTMLIVRRRRWVPSSAGNGAGCGRWSPPPRWSNSDHAGKSSYSGEIDYRFLTFQTGSRF